MKNIVTGGTGFIVSQVASFPADDAKVVGGDNLSVTPPDGVKKLWDGTRCEKPLFRGVSGDL